LEYVSGEGSRLPQAENFGEVGLNIFEADIKDALEARGINLLPQYGVSKYRIDLVALHPEKPGKPVLAIECDGKTYHSCATARDRDRIRQQQLMKLGWRFHRIWSTDWFMNRQEEIERTVAAFEDAVKISDLMVVHNVDKIRQPAPKNNNDNFNPTIIPTRQPKPNIVLKVDIAAYKKSELRAVAKWVMSDGLLRTDDEIMQEMREFLGFKRIGSRIHRVFKIVINDVRSRR